MSDAEKRVEKQDAVLAEFTRGLFLWEGAGERQRRMADEIVQQRRRAERAERILAALREPSERVVEAALNEYDRRYSHGPLSMRLTRHEPYHRASLTESLSAAVAAAEQEVG